MCEFLTLGRCLASVVRHICRTTQGQLMRKCPKRRVCDGPFQLERLGSRHANFVNSLNVHWSITTLLSSLTYCLETFQGFVKNYSLILDKYLLHSALKLMHYALKSAMTFFCVVWSAVPPCPINFTTPPTTTEARRI